MYRSAKLVNTKVRKNPEIESGSLMLEPKKVRTTIFHKVCLSKKYHIMGNFVQWCWQDVLLCRSFGLFHTKDFWPIPCQVTKCFQVSGDWTLHEIFWTKLGFPPRKKDTQLHYGTRFFLKD